MSLERYRPAEQLDWSDQIEAARREALDEFRAMRGDDPQWCRATSDEAWRRILVYQTLALIFAGIRGDDAREEQRRWETAAVEALRSFRYRVDSNEDGVLDDASVTEAEQTVREVEILR